MDLMDPIVSELAKEREDDMSSLAAEFAAQMRKRVAISQGETIPGFEVLGDKRLKWSSPNEEAQKSLTTITMDSP